MCQRRTEHGCVGHNTQTACMQPHLCGRKINNVRTCCPATLTSLLRRWQPQPQPHDALTRMPPNAIRFQIGTHFASAAEGPDAIHNKTAAHTALLLQLLPCCLLTRSLAHSLIHSLTHSINQPLQLLTVGPEPTDWPYRTTVCRLMPWSASSDCSTALMSQQVAAMLG